MSFYLNLVIFGVMSPIYVFLLPSLPRPLDRLVYYFDRYCIELSLLTLFLFLLQGVIARRLRYQALRGYKGL